MSAAGSMADAEAGEFRDLLEMTLDIGVFAARWSHCDRVSSYLARMVSHNRRDSLLYANLFSSALNELLETAFRSHGSAGPLKCRVLRAGDLDRIELTIPCEPDDVEFYREAVRLAQGPQAGNQYRNVLFSTGDLDPRVGLLELAVDYGARLTVSSAGQGSVRLLADLKLEDADQE